MNQIGTPFGKVFGLKSILTFSSIVGDISVPTLDGIQPSLWLDFDSQTYATRKLDGQDYSFADIEPTLLLDFTNETYGIRALNGGDYILDGIEPALLLDFNNKTYGD